MQVVQFRLIALAKVYGQHAAMERIQLPIPSELLEELEESFYQGPMLNEHGTRMLSEDLVARVNKMRIVIEADEHPPPHFHVMFAGENASFSIIDGRRLPKVRGLERFEHNVRKWWKDHYCELIAVWNNTRPTDCQVGPVSVPKECE